jgi:hypothetical protein
LPHAFGRNKKMEKKTKGKKNVPSDIPIVWVNIVEADTESTAVL